MSQKGGERIGDSKEESAGQEKGCNQKTSGHKESHGQETSGKKESACEEKSRNQKTVTFLRLGMTPDG